MNKELNSIKISRLVSHFTNFVETRCSSLAVAIFSYCLVCSIFNNAIDPVKIKSFLSNFEQNFVQS